MPITRAAEAPTFILPGLEFSGLTAPSRGAREICTWRLDVAPQTPSGDPHWLDHEEVFIMISGALVVTIDGAAETIHTGDAIAIPAGAHIQVGNATDTPALALVCLPVGARATMANGQEVGTPPWAQ